MDIYWPELRSAEVGEAIKIIVSVVKIVTTDWCHLADPIIKIDHPDNESGGMTYMSLRPFPLVGAQV